MQPLPALFAVGGLLLSASPLLAWEIESFDAELAVQPDGSVRVTETIVADFQGEERHGIYRDIPLKTQDRLGIHRSIRLTDVRAVDEDGRPWERQISRRGAYRRIRLGSADRTYSGRKAFRLSYRVDRLLQSFPDHDELYWNATGNDWAVPMRRVSSTVRLPAGSMAGLPKPVGQGQLQTLAFTGAYGSTGRDVEIRVDGEAPPAGGTFLDENVGEDAVRFIVTRPLAAFEGLTVAVGWPPGVVPLPTAGQRMVWLFQDNWPLAIPLIVLLGMALIWLSFGRDPPLASIAAQYEPPEGLTPAEVGTLVDDRVDIRDITATIVDLARRGYLTIQELEGKEYRLTRVRQPALRAYGPLGPGAPSDAPMLKPHEAMVLGGLFHRGETVQLSDLENEFYKELSGLRALLYGELKRAGYWLASPRAVRGTWYTLAGVAFVIGFFAFMVEAFLLGAALFLSGLVIVGFARFMPRKTGHGAKTLAKILGLREFLQRADQDRIRREASPSALFERLLPYALVFGVANQWAKAFEGIYQVKPDWYVGTGGAHFSPTEFSRRIGTTSRRMGTALSTAPRSSGGSGFSGGGFSGGGGGGGGGGAW